MFDELHEECGVFGCYQVKDAASITYYGLHSLQHRGQESSGISVSDGHQLLTHKGKGLTVDVFNKERLASLSGQMAIGHVRYSTAGGQAVENIQPITCMGHHGFLAIAHNGQINNDAKLKRELEQKGAIFQGSSDSEVILHLIQYAQGSLLDRIKWAANQIDGAFSFLVMDENNVYAVRDRYGLRPLSYVAYQGGYIISSETCAFEVMGVYDHVDIKPGEVIHFDRGLAHHSFYTQDVSANMCAMEYIYFARPDSVIEGMNVHLFRKQSGIRLAQKQPVQADMVIGVPDSSLSAAIGYAEESGLPLETGLVKNRYSTRTFIQPSQALRDRGVKMKLSALSDVIKGKRIVMIDDSIVRGTTSRRIVQLLRDAGATEIHVRIASPVFSYPCFYGVDTARRKELVGSHMSVDEICSAIDADSLGYLETSDLREIAQGIGLCTACFDGHYVAPLYEHEKELSL